jgi:hypothetical protein
MIKGSGVLQSQGGAPKPVAAGAYAMQPARHPHRFSCEADGECVLYLISDGKFDIHYLDDSGKEISLEEAQKQATKL